MSNPRIYMSVPHMNGNEQEFIADAFRTNWLTSLGPNVEGFEREIEERLGEGTRGLAVSSGSAALHLVLRAAGVHEGDIVAVQSATFAASVYPIVYLGARPVFIDSEEVSWNIDPALVEKYLAAAAAKGELPKVLVVVHLYGQHADLDTLAEMCARYGVTMIEDAAESLGATYKGRQTGTTASLAILSFNGNKIITTTGGGMCLAKDPALIDRMRKWATQSREPVVEYEHRELGYNYRMSNILAGVGRGQLRVLDERVRQRQAVAARYADAFESMEGVRLQPVAAWGTHTRWLSVMQFDPSVHSITTNEIVAGMGEANIEVRPVWRPMHTQPLFSGAKTIGGAVSERHFRTALCLPSSSSLTTDDQDRVISRLREVLAR